jgi:hypothetical protein
MVEWMYHCHLEVSSNKGGQPMSKYLLQAHSTDLLWARCGLLLLCIAAWGSWFALALLFRLPCLGGLLGLGRSTSASRPAQCRSKRQVSNNRTKAAANCI